jgi:diphthamide synthase (EF-2-diphthine--ammonia ligase)
MTSHNSVHQSTCSKGWSGFGFLTEVYSCYKAISEGNFDVAYLLNFKDMKRSGPHEINIELLSAQSQAIGIPILHIDFMSYEEEFNLVNTTHSLLMDLCSKTG